MFPNPEHCCWEGLVKVGTNMTGYLLCLTRHFTQFTAIRFNCIGIWRCGCSVPIISLTRTNWNSTVLTGKWSFFGLQTVTSPKSDCKEIIPSPMTASTHPSADRPSSNTSIWELSNVWAFATLTYNCLPLIHTCRLSFQNYLEPEAWFCTYRQYTLKFSLWSPWIFDFIFLLWLLLISHTSL